MQQIKAYLSAICYRIKCRLPLLLAVLIFISYTGLVSLIAGYRAHVKTERAVRAEYEEKLLALKAEQKNEHESVAAEELPEANDEKAEQVIKAEKLAKVLYGIRDNNESDLITACWCVFNRVDIKSGEYAYLKTLEDVISQPEQWMGYSEENPVLENLYQIAYSQLEIWLNEGHRPVSSDYVFLVWSPNKIYLKTALEDNKSTKTWRYNG